MSESLVGATEFVRERLPDGYREGMRVCSAVALLSLDISSGFLFAMGLVDVDGDIVQAAARETARAHRDRPLDRQHRPLADVRDRFLSAIALASNAEQSAGVARWLDHTFVRHLEDHRPWHDWRVCMRHAIVVPEKVQHPDHPVTRETITQVAELLDTSDIDAGIEAVKSMPITDWDLEMFIRRRQNPFDVHTDPYFAISFQAECSRFMRGFPSLVGSLVREECERLERLARRSRAHMKLPVQLVSLDALLGDVPS